MTARIRSAPARRSWRADAAFREQFDAAVSRAVASLPVLCELCLPFVRVGGVMLAYKGRGAREEADAARGAMAALGGRLLRVENARACR